MDKIIELKEFVQNCKKCKLCEERNNVVFGEGNENTNIFL